MIGFTVIDKQTGMYPYLRKIALEEEWAKDLIYSDIVGFLIGEDGYLYLADGCGNFACCPSERFEVRLWTKASDHLPEPFKDTLWCIDGKYIAGYLDDDGNFMAYTVGTEAGFTLNPDINDMSWMYIPKENNNGQ